jgi:hypothetical protein
MSFEIPKVGSSTAVFKAPEGAASLVRTPFQRDTLGSYAKAEQGCGCFSGIGRCVKGLFGCMWNFMVSLLETFCGWEKYKGREKSASSEICRAYNCGVVGCIYVNSPGTFNTWRYEVEQLRTFLKGYDMVNGAFPIDVSKGRLTTTGTLNCILAVDGLSNRDEIFPKLAECVLSGIREVDFTYEYLYLEKYTAENVDHPADAKAICRFLRACILRVVDKEDLSADLLTVLYNNNPNLFYDAVARKKKVAIPRVIFTEKGGIKFHGWAKVNAPDVHQGMRNKT